MFRCLLVVSAVVLGARACTPGDSFDYLALVGQYAPVGTYRRVAASEVAIFGEPACRFVLACVDASVDFGCLGVFQIASNQVL
jgi:hypothetical protein